MPGEMERLYAELDRRYGLHLIPRVRLAVVTDAASPTSYSITLPGETTPRSGVPSVSPIVPQVGDLVRVELVGDQPVIVNTLVRHPPVSADVNAACTATAQTFGAPATGTAGPAVTVDLVAGQTCMVSIYCRISNSVNGAGHQASMSFATTGASGTVAAVAANAIETQSSTATPGYKATPFLATGTGSHTFTSQYLTAVGGETGTFNQRRIIAVPC